MLIRARMFGRSHRSLSSEERAKKKAPFMLRGGEGRAVNPFRKYARIPAEDSRKECPSATILCEWRTELLHDSCSFTYKGICGLP